MRSLILSVCALVVALGSGPSALGVVLYWPGGYCDLKYYFNGNVDPSYYEWDEETGRLWLREPGLWWVQYQRYGGGWADVPEISAYSMYGNEFHLILYGRSLTRTCYFNNVNTTTNKVELMLYEGGSLQAGVTFLAPNSDVVDSRIQGNLAGTLDVRNILSNLTIDGDLSGKLWVEGELPANGSISIGGDVLDAGDSYIRIKKMTGGTFSCRDMNLAQGPWGEDFLIGWGIPEDQYQSTIHTGQITFSGTMRGWLFIGGRSGLDINVGTMQVSDPEEENVGIWCSNRYQPESDITIGQFTSGRIRMGNKAAQFDTDARMAGTITINGSMGSGAKIHTYNPNTNGGEQSLPIDAAINIGGDLAGSIESTGNINGSVDIGGDLAGNVGTGMDSGADILAGNLAGELAVAGNHTGETVIDGSLTGKILIDGSFQDKPGVTYEIDIEGIVASGAAVTIDYDGWDRNDTWKYDTRIRVGGASYTSSPGNYPEVPIWQVSQCKADLNNDWSVNTLDGDLF